MLTPLISAITLKFVRQFVRVAAMALFLAHVALGQDAPAYRSVTQLNSRHPISIIYVDAASQKELGKFPLDRRHYADLLTRLAPAKPRYVVLKFFFTDPRPGDVALVRALQSATTVLTQFAGVDQDEGYSVAQLASWALGSNTFSFPDFPHAWPPTPELAKAFTAAGTVNGGTQDGFFLVTSIRGIVYPSLPLVVLERELGQPAIVRRDHVAVGKVKIPLRPDGTFTFDLSEPGKLYPAHSFADVLAGRVPANSFSSHVVLVFAKTPDAPLFHSSYAQPHGAAEIVADTINTVLKRF